jgi:hypothetical protein
MSVLRGSGASKAVDLSQWLTKREAAAVLRCSEKSVERLVAAAKLEQRMRPGDRGRSVAVYPPSAVASLRPAGLAVLPPMPADSGRGPAVLRAAAGGKLLPPPGSFEALARQLAGLAQLAESLSPQSDRCVYVSMDAAVRISGLSEATIRDLYISGRVYAMKFGRGLRYRRADLLLL